MVSRRNYIAITMMLLILVFMFQFTGVMKEQLNEYGINEYEETTKAGWTKSDEFVADGAQNKYVAYVGEQSGDIAQVVNWWCTYNKQNMLQYESLRSYESEGQEGAAEIIVIDGSLVKTQEDIETLMSCVQAGVNLIFARMPETAVVSGSETLKRLLGISAVIQDEVTLTGMHLFEGFLLGGEAVYEAKEEKDAVRQDLELSVPWYVTGVGTKTYMSGIMEDDRFNELIPEQIAMQYSGLSEADRKNLLLPAVIWRNSIDSAKIFCVNGSYLSDISGVGILNAMQGEISQYQIYPIINAQSLVVADYPGFADENEEELGQRYSQSVTALQREIIWPALSSLAQRTNAKLTCMMTPQYDYQDEELPDGESVSYYLKLLREEHGEVGLSGNSVSDIAVTEKLREDALFWEKYAPEFSFLSLYLQDTAQMKAASETELQKNVRTVVVDETVGAEPIVSYVTENVTLQRATGNGKTHTFSEDFKLKCIESALGYSNVVLDLMDVVYPKTTSDSWENMGRDVSANLVTYWKPFLMFDSTTLSESDQRIRRFLALDYSDERVENEIHLNISQFEEEAWFLFRSSEEEVTKVEGGIYTKVEEGAYIIKAENPKITISVKTSADTFYSKGQVIEER